MARKSYVGKAPLTMARTENRGYVHIYAGDPVPDGIDGEDLQRLVKRGFLEEAPEVEEDGTVEADADDSKPASVKDVKAEVGDDADKARAALEAEQASEKPRPSLVDHLNKVIADAEQG